MTFLTCKKIVDFFNCAHSVSYKNNLLIQKINKVFLEDLQIYILILPHLGYFPLF